MRRLASLGLLLALTGCGYVGNPLAGAFDLISDTVTFKSNPNAPSGDSDNMRRVQGQATNSDPLVPEAGQVWPGPLPPDKTLGDIERQNATELLKSGQEMNLTPGHGSSVQPSAPPKAMLIPNGNGTSTLIAPDGSVKTVPTPK